MTPTQQPRLQETLMGHYAGLTSRILAFILDTLILGGIILFTGWFLATSWTMLQVRPILDEILKRNAFLNNLSEIVASPLVYSLFTLLFIISYYVFFWTIAGQTPGKGIMGLRIVPRRGGKLKLGRAILRYFGYYLSVLPLGLGIFWILVDDRRLAWHDKIAGTCVIYAWDAKPDENFLAIETSRIIARTQALRAYLDKKKRK
jgi:uncharacterized RDD family membrane protein YckC